MRPQSDKVADYLFDGLAPAELDSMADIVGRLIERLEATDAKGRSAFLEATRPD
jgi:hypothetical protein